MCISIPKSLLFLSAFCLFSLSAFSQDGSSQLASRQPLQELEQVSEILNAPPEMLSPQINPQLSLEKRQALMLKAWIEWYNAEMTWRKQVQYSWTKAKDSYEKLDSKRVLEINSRDIQIELLESELKKTKIERIYAAAGGLAVGAIAGLLVK